MSLRSARRPRQSSDLRMNASVGGLGSVPGFTGAGVPGFTGAGEMCASSASRKASGCSMFGVWPGLLEERLGDRAAGRRVRLQHVSHLAHHLLRGRGLLAGPAGDDPELAQVVDVEERRVRHDGVGVAVDPEDRAASRRGRRCPATLKYFGRQGVQHADAAGCEARPVRRALRIARVVARRGRGGQHRLDPDVLVLGREARRDVGGAEDGPRGGLGASSLVSLSMRRCTKSGFAVPAPVPASSSVSREPSRRVPPKPYGETGASRVRLSAG